MKIVLASHNKGKIQEVTDILAPFGIEVEPIPEDFRKLKKTAIPSRKTQRSRRGRCVRQPSAGSQR